MARGPLRPLTDSGFPLLDFEIPPRTLRRILPSVRCSSVHSLQAFCTAETKSERRENPASECGAFPAIDSWALFPCRAQKARINDREGSALRTPRRGGVVLFSKGMGDGMDRRWSVLSPKFQPDVRISVTIFRCEFSGRTLAGAAHVGGRAAPLSNERAGIAEPASRWGNRAASRFQPL